MKFNWQFNFKNSGFRLTLMVSALVFIGLFAWLGVYPYYLKTVTKAQSSVAAATLEAKQKQLAQLQSLINNYQQLSEQDLKKLEQSLPSKQAVDLLLTQLDGLLQASGFSLNSLIVSAPTTTATTTADGSQLEKKGESNVWASHLKGLNVTISTGGPAGYASFKRLLGNLENHIRLFDLSAVSFTPEATNYTLSFKTYYWE
jgi:Tfp pilus assembly protein PilE